jgi:hypothetical protein
VYKINFFYERYDSTVKKLVAPKFHGDYFKAVDGATNSIVFGDFFTGVTYGFGKNTEPVVVDTKSNFYATYLNAEWATYFSGDTMNSTANLPTSPVWDGQKGNDVVIGNVRKVKTEPFVETHMQRLFTEQEETIQMCR